MDPRYVAILTIGSELVRGRVDTDGPWLATRLQRLGFQVVYRLTLPDDVGAIEAGLRFARDRAFLIFLTGGLGPTPDDVTREAVARCLGRRLVKHSDVHARLQQYYEGQGIQVPPTVYRMAQVIEGAEVLLNPVGAAPGQWIETDAGILVLLPGPPAELQGVYEAALEAKLRARVVWPLPRWVRLRTVGVPESQIVERLETLLNASSVRWSILPSPAQVDIEIEWEGADDVAWQALVQAVREVLGEDCIGEGEVTLEQVIGEYLRARGQTLAIAESCTGGLVSHRITNVPGSSDYFMRGYVVYSNEAKVDLLGVAPATLAAYGAVSEPVAREMAEGARKRAGTDWAIAITGIAGPTGGTPQKPVGTVHVAIAGPDGTTHRRFLFAGTREQIKWQSAQMALDMLRRRLA